MTRGKLRAGLKSHAYNSMKKRDWFFIVGVILVTLAFIAACMLLYIYFLYYVLAVFVAGVILVWFSKRKTLTKILVSILPVALWYPGVFASFYLLNSHMTPSTYLVPKEFRGEIRIFYGEPSGERISETDGRLIFHVPHNGVMIVSNPAESGIINDKFYFVDERGEIANAIREFDQRDFNEVYTTEKNPHEPPRNVIWVFSGGSFAGGSIVPMAQQNSKPADTQLEVRGRQWYVMSWDSLRVFDPLSLREKFADSLLAVCRAEHKSN